MYDVDQVLYHFLLWRQVFIIYNYDFRAALFFQEPFKSVETESYKSVLMGYDYS